MSLDIKLSRQIIGETLSEFNITHNLIGIWKLAGIYFDLYHSEGLRAEEIVQNLEKGLQKIKDNPIAFKSVESKNGWGTYEDAINFLEIVIDKCLLNPKAIISIYK